MPRVYLSLGSNINRKHNIRDAVALLENKFMPLLISPVYESESVGFEGDAFYNLAVGLDTDLSVAELSRYLRELEEQHGRDRSAPKFSSRTLDIDILTYGNACGDIDGIDLPRAEILKNAFVLKPLADIAGNDKHPETLRSFAEHWDAYDKNKQKLWAIDFTWA
jgi:2-amino-4-hydroxy-6-hydroxymethyldihydropteridine diphosphokinase